MANLLEHIAKFQPFSLCFIAMMHQYPLIQCKIFLLLVDAHLFFNMLNNLELLQLAGIIRMQQLNLVPSINKKVLFYQGLAVV